MTARMGAVGRFISGPVPRPIYETVGTVGHMSGTSSSDAASNSSVGDFGPDDVDWTAFVKETHAIGRKLKRLAEVIGAAIS